MSLRSKATPSRVGPLAPRQPRFRRSYTADELALTISTENQLQVPRGSRSREHQSGRQLQDCYMPNQSLYSGNCTPFEDPEYYLEDEYDRADVPSMAEAITPHTRPEDQANHTPPGSQQFESRATINFADLIQEQQKLLREVLSNQNEMKEKQKEFEQKLSDLSSKVNSYSGSSPDSGSGAKKKCRIKRDLTVSFNNLSPFVIVGLYQGIL